MKKVYLPKHTGQEAEFYALKKMQKYGIGKDHPNYDEIKNDLIQNFAHQSYKSLSANFHDLVDFEGDNPTTAKINKKVFHVFKELYGKDGFFTEAQSKGDAQQLERLYRSAVTTLVKIILKVRSNIVLKAKEGKPSDLAFNADSEKADNLQVIYNQYIQAYLATLITVHLEPIFKAKAWNIEDLVKSLGDESFLKAIDSNVPKEVRYDLLHNDEMRTQFVKAVYDGYKNGKITAYSRVLKEQKESEKKTVEEINIETMKSALKDIFLSYRDGFYSSPEFVQVLKDFATSQKLPVSDPINLLNKAKELGLDNDSYKIILDRINKEITIKSNPVSSGRMVGIGQLIKADSIGATKAKAYVRIKNPSNGQSVIVSGIVSKSSMKNMFPKEMIGVELDISKGRHGLTKVSKIK